MQSMTVIEVLNLVYTTLQECSIPIRDAGRASAAMNLLAECIDALKVPADKKEESK